jgi:lipopolysaccharide/colanic/teichoic acid biosynthesis glycosyltransferase
MWAAPLRFELLAGGEAESALPWAPCCRTLSYRVLKRGLDVVFSAGGLILLSPVFLLIILAVKATSPGPALYSWRVLGAQGRPFKSYKFRSMVDNADAGKGRLEQHNERSGPLFKMTRDPRVTAVGRFLRKFSLDELPQLWSILKGDMSFVGPRPVFPAEWEGFEEWQRRKLSVTPGAVSLWHVRGRSKEFSEWIELDLAYIDHWSIWQDLRILLGAVPYILLGKNC